MKVRDRYICTINTYDEDWETWLVTKDSMQETDGSTFYGLCINSSHELKIANDLDPFNEIKTVYHEVTHAFNNSLNNGKQTFTIEEVCEFIGRYGKNIHEQSQKILQGLNEMEVRK